MEKKYVLAHKENNVVFLNITINQEAFSHKLIQEYLGLPRLGENYVLFKHGTEEWFCNQDILQDLNKKISEKIRSENNYGKKLLSKTEQIAENLYENYYALLDLLRNKKINFEEVSDKWEEGIELFFRICSVGLGAVLADLGHVSAMRYSLSNALEEIVNEKIKQYKLKRSVGEYVGILVKTSLKTKNYIFKERLLALYQEINKLKMENIWFKNSADKLILLLKKNYQDLFLELNNLIYRFSWIDYGHTGPEMNLQKLIQKIQLLLKNKEETDNLREAIDLRSLIKLQERCTKELNLNESERHYFEIARELSGAKVIRSELLFFTFYLLTLTLKKFAQKSEKNYKDLQSLTRFEFIKMLRGGKIPNISVLKERYNFCISYVKDLNDSKIFTGERAKKIIRDKFQVEGAKKTDIIRGNIACAGKVEGVVKIINEPREIRKMKKGDILVAVQTIPQLLPAMKLAAAFVTDIGGITSHAAIVSREMNKPCIIGTKIATKVLKDGDLVEVDADKGIVRKLK